MAQNQNQITRFLLLRDVLEIEDVSPSASKLLNRKYRYCVGLTCAGEFFESLFQYGIVMNLMLQEEFKTLAIFMEQFKPISELIQEFDIKLSKCLRHLRISPDADYKGIRLRQKAIKYYPLVQEMFRTYTREVLLQNKGDGVLQQFGLQSGRLQNLVNIFSSKNEGDFENLFKLFPELFGLNFQAFYYDEQTKSVGKFTKQIPESKLSCSILIIRSSYFLLYSKPQFLIETADYRNYANKLDLKLPILRSFFQEDKRDPFDSLQVSHHPRRESVASNSYFKVSKDIEGIYEELKMINCKMDQKMQGNDAQLKKMEVKVKQLEEDQEELQEIITAKEDEKNSMLKVCIGMGVQIVKVLHKRSPPSALIKHFEQMSEFAEQEELVTFINQNLIKRINNADRAFKSLYSESQKKQNSFESMPSKNFEEDLDFIRRERDATQKLKEQGKNEKLARIFDSKASLQKSVKKSSSFSSQENMGEIMESKKSNKALTNEMEDEKKFNSDSLESSGKESQRRKKIIQRESERKKELKKKESSDSLESKSAGSIIDDVNLSRLNNIKKNKQLSSSSSSGNKSEKKLEEENKEQDDVRKSRIGNIKNKQIIASDSDSNDSLEKKEDKPKMNQSRLSVVKKQNKKQLRDTTSEDSLEERKEQEAKVVKVQPIKKKQLNSSGSSNDDSLEVKKLDREPKKASITEKRKPKKIASSSSESSDSHDSLENRI